ncbi:MAP kinase kinase skh1/pek1 [Beauveria bassiana ARSEF 2860]|uniref:MAP kinase kinase skh1/pek1 n=1 Tax=Beauveria bassiana (strain ARSEF 2860) TaxID=655819 RepID=J4ULB9_BEAB2|nr:MAP kinase kinase skh1/pek1 [Beauveria bassiana ARSEF 2860]EJP65257.1 MAP kinase kinase skh1/pek1 [Beauveria bassiana ARSEF 2860]
MIARDRQRGGSPTVAERRSAPAAFSDSTNDGSGSFQSLRQDLERIHYESLPGARIMIARPPSIRHGAAEHVPLLQPAEFVSQTRDGRSIMGVLQRIEDVCFRLFVPFIAIPSRPPWARFVKDELRCIISYNPASDACEFFCSSHDVALIGESSLHSHLVRRRDIQSIEPGMWTVAVPSSSAPGETFFGRPRRVVEFLLLKRKCSVTLTRPAAAGMDGSLTPLPETDSAINMQSAKAPVHQIVADFIMGAVEPSEPADKQLPRIPEGEMLTLDPDPFYRLQDGETVRVTTIPAGSNDAGIEQRYAETAESYQVTRLQKIDRSRHSSVFACIHSKLPHSTLVAKALNVTSRTRRSVTSLANHWSNEMEILKTLDHRNIVKLLSWDARFYTVYLEHLPDSLATYHKEPGFTREDAETILKDVGSALAYLEEKKISHNDIKPRNIAYSPERGAVVLDFGLASAGRWVPRATGGTAWYVPPETLRVGERTNRGNVWAFGVTMLYVLCKIDMPEDYCSPWDFLNMQDPNSDDRIAMESWADQVGEVVDDLKLEDPVECVVAWMMDQEPHERLEAVEIIPALLKKQQEREEEREKKEREEKEREEN